MAQAFREYYSKTQQATARVLTGITVEGTDGLQAALQAFGASALDAASGALYRVAEEIMTKAKELTPVDTGNLRASGHVLPPERTDRWITVTLGFGGPAGTGKGQDKDVGYAIPVHERLDMTHKPPGQAKYLEQPMLEAAAELEGRLAAELRAELGT